MPVDTVILDVDTLLGQIEIRLVLAIKGAGCLVLVSRLTLVGDTLLEQVVRHQALTQAFHGLAFQGADIIGKDVVVVLPL